MPIRPQSSSSSGSNGAAGEQSSITAWKAARIRSVARSNTARNRSRLVPNIRTT